MIDKLYIYDGQNYLFKERSAKLVRIIGWTFFVMFFASLIINVVSFSVDLKIFIAIFFSAIFFLMTRFDLEYKLSRDGFKMSATSPIFRFLDKEAVFKRDGYQFLCLTRAGGSNFGDQVVARRNYYMVITTRKGAEFYGFEWQEVLSLLNCYSSSNPEDVKAFGYELSEFTGLKLIVDPRWDVHYGGLKDE